MEPRKCAQCGEHLRFLQLPTIGRVWLCLTCERATMNDRVFRFQEQPIDSAAAAPGKRSFTHQERRTSTRACPECDQPMWVVIEPGYGRRHQCDNCRLTVLFGGAIQRWRGPARKPAGEAG